MQIYFTFRQMNSSPSTKEFITSKLQKLTKFLDDDNADVYVMLSSEKHLNTVELSLNAYGVLMKASETSPDLNQSIDNAIEKIQKQLMRKRGKVIRKYRVHGTGKIKTIQK